jgi:RND family efflux transporter MFP subunit
VKRSLWTCTLLLSFLFLSSCSKSSATAARGGVRPVAVRVAGVAAQDVTYQVKALGSLEAAEMVQVTAEVEGAVSEVLFHEGDRVTAETVLLRIDPDRYRLEAERATANLRRAEADARRAETDLKRREDLARESLVSVEELNRSHGESESLRAEAAAAAAAEKIAQQNLRRSEVRAALAGVINTRSVEVGMFVKNGNILATLVDASRLRLRFRVSEAESLRVKKGEQVRFAIKAMGDRDFSARIYHVGEVADPVTRQVEVLAWVANPGPLKPGFFAEVNLATETHAGALVVPEGAVQASERGFVTYVVVDGKASLREIEIGLRTGTGIVEILSGLKAGESVVVEGSDRLGNGVPVQAAGEPRGAGAPGTAAP